MTKVRGHKNVPEDTRLKFQADLTDPRHGTDNGYKNLGCRCALCTKANSKAHYAYMHGDHGARLARHANRENTRYHLKRLDS